MLWMCCTRRPLDATSSCEQVVGNCWRLEQTDFCKIFNTIKYITDTLNIQKLCHYCVRSIKSGTSSDEMLSPDEGFYFFNPPPRQPDEATTLFRATTLASTLMEQYMKATATPFVHHALKDTILKIMESKQSCEVRRPHEAFLLD